MGIVNDKVIYAIYRRSEHWLTNTARGARGEACEITPELEELCIQAARAVGGGLLAIDLIEHPTKGLLVNEINHTMEFHTAQPTIGVDIASLFVNYILQVAEEGNASR